jgi:hypothetical protein
VPTEDRLSLLLNKIVSCLIIEVNLINHFCADRGEVNTLHSLSYFNYLLFYAFTFRKQNQSKSLLIN